MKTLVVYDSQFGNTKKVAETVAAVLKGKAVNVSDFHDEMLKGVTVLIVGSPILGWRPSVKTATFLSSLLPGSLVAMSVAAFDTRVNVFFSGDASKKIEKQLVSFGGKQIVPPGKFYVKGKEGPLTEGELEKAKTWAKAILTVVESGK
jgi:flavodoxin